MHYAARLEKIVGIEVENGAWVTRQAQWPGGGAARQGFHRRLGQTKEQGWQQDSHSGLQLSVCVLV